MLSVFFLSSTWATVVKVTAVTAVPVSGSEVKVVWDCNANIDHYTIYLTVLLAGMLQNALSIQVPGQESSALIPLDELTPNVKYQFQVSATILDGESQLVEGERTPVTTQSTVTFGK